MRLSRLWTWFRVNDKDVAYKGATTWPQQKALNKREPRRVRRDRPRFKRA